MPHALAADGTRIHFTVSGKADGEPLLLIQGLGADSRGWILQKFALGRRYRCISVDNRGVGKSDKPAGPYDLEVMANDALAALDAAGFESAHVMGASMGGVLSQIIAVRHPERVRSLVLACTACRHLPWRRELLTEWAELAESGGMNSFVSQNMRWLVGPRSMRRFAPALAVLSPVAMSAPTEAFVAQVHAILNMDDALRLLLPSITAPTLVLVGSQDILTPQADAEEIAELIPGAELAVVRGGAHGFMVESFGTYNRVVLDFLGRVGGDAAVRAAAPALRRADGSGRP